MTIIELQEFILRNCDPCDMTVEDEKLFYECDKDLYPEDYEDEDTD